MDESIDSTAQIGNREEEAVESPEVVDNSQKTNEVEQRLRHELEKEREATRRARKREEELMKKLEEERRESRARIEELEAKNAQYEKGKTIVHAMVTSYGIPEDCFPEEIMSQAVELDLFEMQNTMVNDNSGEADDNGERMEVDEEEEEEESPLTDFVVGLSEGKKMGERKTKELITMMETIGKEKTAKYIIEGLMKIQPEYISYLSSLSDPISEPPSTAPRRNNPVKGNSNSVMDRDGPSLESKLIKLLVEVYKGKHGKEAAVQYMGAHINFMEATTITECLIKAVRKFPKRRNSIRKTRSEAVSPRDLSPGDMGMDMDAPPPHSPAASVAVSSEDGDERGTSVAAGGTSASAEEKKRQDETSKRTKSVKKGLILVKPVKDKKPWPKLNYEVPSTSIKPNREEEQKAQAMFEQIEKKEKELKRTDKRKREAESSEEESGEEKEEDEEEENGEERDENEVEDSGDEKDEEESGEESE